MPAPKVKKGRREKEEKEQNHEPKERNKRTLAREGERKTYGIGIKRWEQTRQLMASLTKIRAGDGN